MKKRRDYRAKRNCHYCRFGVNKFFPRPMIDKVESTVCHLEVSDPIKLSHHEVKGLTNNCHNYIQARVRLRDGNAPSQIKQNGK